MIAEITGFTASDHLTICGFRKAAASEVAPPAYRCERRATAMGMNQGLKTPPTAITLSRVLAPTYSTNQIKP
jgi:hypothetical protein